MTEPSCILTSPPRCITVRDAIATPFEMLPHSERPEIEVPKGFKLFTRGCLYDGDGARVDLSVRIGANRGDQSRSIDPDVLEPQQRETTARLWGRSLYLGYFMNHYGHFITEMLSRCWWQEAAVSFDHIVAYPYVHDGGKILTAEHHRYLMGLMGIPVDRVEILTQPTLLDEVVVPEQLWTLNLTVNAHMRDIYDRIRAKHVSKNQHGRIFLSRPTGWGNRIGNPLAVEEVFAGYGFRVLRPEQIPIADQLEIYANCEILASLSGSGMHNCLFSRPGLMTIDVGDRRSRIQPSTTQRMVNEVSQVEVNFIPFGEGEHREIDVKRVRKQVRDILGERPTLTPLLRLRTQRLNVKLRARIKSWRKRIKRRLR